MCGFLGKVSLDKFDTSKFTHANNYTVCRGPDSKKCKNGQFENVLDSSKALYYNLIFNRLSIIDLSEKAMQPMYSKNYKSWIMFNGEIYNHKELRIFLEKKGIKFYTDHSDTEVLLNGISHLGNDFINKIVGQFSIVFFDEKKQLLKLIRDRVGQKPLFYKIENNSVSFGSNLKSLINIQNSYELSTKQINNYISFGIVPSPNTLFEGINKLEPGKILEIEFTTKDLKITETEYWLIDDFIDEKTFSESEFFEIFNEAIQIRLESDVPVANLLSGGIDSTSIIKSLYDNSSLNLNTFSITNQNDKYDESKWINKVVEKYNTNHISSDVSMNLDDDDIFTSIDIFDEPYCDPSTVPSYILSKEIANDYKVAISGDGGDELLAGYTRQNFTLNARSYPKELIGGIFKLYPGFIGTGNNILRRSNDIKVAYSSYFEDSKLMNMMGLSSNLNFSDRFINISNNLYKDLMSTEYKFFLYEMMTLKVDRTSMANSVEIRSPYLDHRLIEYILGTKNTYYNKDKPKNIMKNYLAKDFDRAFLERNKQGFVFNLEGWVFNHLDTISDVVSNGKFVSQHNSNILKSLSLNKSRINGLRIWKLFFLERYLDNL
jgi:asparagine synthase (glutamine-hydrolysing)